MLSARLRGARTHNLKGIDVTIHPGEVVAITGVSGSGKSSLALDTLYAEGQRRFVESFSPYARQFLERLERPPVDELEPVPAGIAVDRRAPVKSSRSTVATMADLEPYLAALFTREAVAVCPEHGDEAQDLTPVAAADHLLTAHPGIRVVVAYRVWVEQTEQYLAIRERLAEEGYRRLWLGGKTMDLDEVKPSRLTKAGEAFVVVDRLSASNTERDRLAAAVEEAWLRGEGVAQIFHPDSEQQPMILRRGLSCPKCARPLSPAVPGLFSYESPVGACGTCRGFGRVIGVDLDKVIPDPEKTLARGAVRPWNGKSTAWERTALQKLCERNRVPTDRPWKDLTEAQRQTVLEGDGSWNKGKFPGIMGWFRWLETRTYKMHVRVFLARYRSYDPCPECRGRRLNEQALSYRVGNIDIAAWHELEIREARARLADLKTKTGQGAVARSELATRLEYLERVGLGYLTLDRQARTLSGGEAQRVTLTAALGTSLHNALFVLDEPSVGLHPTDVEPLAEIVRDLARRGNAVLVVEHDPTLIRAADRVVELGPGAGSEGGTLVFDGTPTQAQKKRGATARALSPATPARRELKKADEWIHVRGARANNLHGFDVDVPLGVLCAVTGPSGSGKSTLAVDILYRALARRLGVVGVERPGEHDSIESAEAIRQVVLVDQAPLGRTSRGNAATYTKAWDAIRRRLAAEPSAQARGLSASSFSFNVEGGRCGACSGEGHETVEMQFLADVRLVCPVCKGKRFGEEALAVEYRGKNVADLLEQTVDETLAHFADEPAVQRAFGPVRLLGLGYLRAGQPLSTLSGGEAQRLKLARSLADDHRGALLVLDEPSAGLHADEVARVLEALDVIVEGGGSVVIVEHDVDLISRSDWVIDLGPDAGVQGGRVVACGTPEEVAATLGRTGVALRARKQGPPRTAAAGRKRRKAAPRALVVSQAREHNLRDVSVEIPHGALTVVTGPSGSGKSTLAFDVAFAEGQRRFLETLTPYARQFLPTMPRPDVDSVTGVPPSIALEQRSTRAGSKSTVATVTEVAHYLRLLYAKVGVPHCPEHDEPIHLVAPEAVLETVRSVTGRIDLLAPAIEARKGTYLDIFAAAARAGVESAICDGKLVSTDRPPRLKKTQEHSIDLVVASGITAKSISSEQFARAMRWGHGAVKVVDARGKVTRFSSRSACPRCGFSVPELDPRFFSFNTAQGRCATCSGEGVVEATKQRGRRAKNTKKEGEGPPPVVCPDCLGTRLSPVPRAVRVFGLRYSDVVALPVSATITTVSGWKFSSDRKLIADPVLEELMRRLAFLRDVGLDYLALDRAARTLSGGEMQRLRLAAQLGAGLTGALYVLDEPTIGLHPRDTGRLLDNLRRLVQIGSTVLVVEHDADTIRAADYLIDLGPGGGTEGGHVVAAGAPRRVLRQSDSPTGVALSRPPELRAALAVADGAPRLKLLGARANNLRDVNLEIPRGRFTVIAGVSGSGKSTLVRQVLLPAVRKSLGLVGDTPGAHDRLSGLGELKRAIAVDQSPIGRTPRSVPATFLGIWNHIRALFAATQDAKMRGFAAARFSFNAAGGGRCEGCDGQGAITHEMSFLPDVVAMCPACGGLRFEPRTLEVRYLEYSIGEVLDLTAEEAALVFRNHPKISAPLRTLVDLGAGYVRLGQGSHTLSGGEAQRLKLAAELTASTRHEPTLYVLDEPTTGLHLQDVSRLVEVLGRLVSRGDTLVVIEHHPIVMSGADWLIELGPEGGTGGGKIIAQGPPRALRRKRTPTAKVLEEIYTEATVARRGREHVGSHAAI